MGRQYYSLRKGSNPNLNGLSLADLLDLFVRVFNRLREEGYFDEAFGFTCIDEGELPGTLHDPELEMHLALRKKGLWPIRDQANSYNEDDLFDVIEFLFQQVSKPVEGAMHSYGQCGMHWETFNQILGRQEYRERINAMLGHYEHAFQISADGEVLHDPELGFELIFDADLPTTDQNVFARVAAATRRYRTRGSTLDDRRQAVRDLVDVLEYLRPKIKALLTKADENDLFAIANNFGIRHHNDKQRMGYDANIWLSWMFYFYLATIHVVLRKLQHDRIR